MAIVKERESFEELQRQARLGRAVSDFASHPSWEKYIKPYLEAARLNIALQNTKITSNMLLSHDHPSNGKTMDMVALASAVNSGKLAFIEQFLDQIKTWIEEGRDAESKLGRIEIK